MARPKKSVRFQDGSDSDRKSPSPSSPRLDNSRASAPIEPPRMLEQIRRLTAAGLGRRRGAEDSSRASSRRRSDHVVGYDQTPVQPRVPDPARSPLTPDRASRFDGSEAGIAPPNHRPRSVNIDKVQDPNQGQPASFAGGRDGYGHGHEPASRPAGQHKPKRPKEKPAQAQSHPPKPAQIPAPHSSTRPAVIPKKASSCDCVDDDDDRETPAPRPFSHRPADEPKVQPQNPAQRPPATPPKETSGRDGDGDDVDRGTGPAPAPTPDRSALGDETDGQVRGPRHDRPSTISMRVRSRDDDRDDPGHGGYYLRRKRGSSGNSRWNARVYLLRRSDELDKVRYYARARPYWPDDRSLYLYAPCDPDICAVYIRNY